MFKENKGSTILSDLWDRYLECSICAENYDDDNHVPKQLPCQHTYCTSCLHKLSKSAGHLKCPQCKQVHKEVSDVRKYPKDLTRGDLLDYVREKAGSKCDNCQKAIAEYDCATCATRLCKKCKVKVHSKILYQSHTIRIINKKRKADRGRCQENGHDNGLQKFFCKECGQLVCANCIFSHHRNESLHTIESAESLFQNYRSRVDELALSMKLELLFVNLQYRCIQTRLRGVKIDKEQLIRLFNALYTSGESRQVRQHEYLIFCDQVCRGATDVLKEQLQMCAQPLEQLKNMKANVTNSIPQGADAFTFLPSSMSVMDSMDQLENSFRTTLNQVKDIMDKVGEVPVDRGDIVAGQPYNANVKGMC